MAPGVSLAIPDVTSSLRRLGDSISLSNASVPQGSANGTAVGTASISGAFTGTPAWSLTDGSGTFQINSSTGAVTVLSNTDLASPGSIPISLSVSGVTPTVPPANVNIAVTPSGGGSNFNALFAGIF